MEFRLLPRLRISATLSSVGAGSEILLFLKTAESTRPCVTHGLSGTGNTTPKKNWDSFWKAIPRNVTLKGRLPTKCDSEPNAAPRVTHGAPATNAPACKRGIGKASSYLREASIVNERIDRVKVWMVEDV